MRMNRFPQFLLLTASMVLASCADDDDSVSVGECSIPEGNSQLYDYMEESYFWNDELSQTFSPDSYQSMADALDALRVEQDRFSFLMSEQDYQSSYVQSKFFGYGFGHRINSDRSGLSITFVYDQGSAAQNGLRRGDTIVEVDGESMTNLLTRVSAGTLTFNDIFGPNEEGFTLDITFKKPSGELIETQFVKSEFEYNTVLAAQTHNINLPSGQINVGYLVFQSFRDISVGELNSAIDQFADANVDELILDLRYNGGGLIRVANQLSSQIGGDNVLGEVFSQTVHNSNLSSENSVDAFSLGQGIGQLNLDRVVVLTTRGSCSASELLINSLSPFIEVVVVGDYTCGKPVGMYPNQICDQRVFAINFQTQNAVGFGDYFDGLPPTCSVSDQVVADWGNVADPLFNAGMSYLTDMQCPAATALGKPLSIQQINKQVKAHWTQKDAL